MEDDAGQVEEHLVPLHLELAALVELRVAEPDPAELQVLLEDGLVVAVEYVAAVGLVDDLRDPDDLAARVLDGVAEHGAGAVAGHVVHLGVEAVVRVAVRDVDGRAALGHVAHDAAVPRDADLRLLVHLLHRRVGADVEEVRDEAVGVRPRVPLHQEQRAPEEKRSFILSFIYC